MGFRTTVILYNDQASEWSNDPSLGKKISHAMNFASSSNRAPGHWENDFGTGRVVECVHADTQTIALFDTYNMHSLGHSYWSQDETIEAAKLKLLKEAADKLGFRLVKKPVLQNVHTPS